MKILIICGILLFIIVASIFIYSLYKTAKDADNITEEFLQQQDDDDDYWDFKDYSDSKEDEVE